MFVYVDFIWRHAWLKNIFLDILCKEPLNSMLLVEGIMETYILA